MRNILILGAGGQIARLVTGSLSAKKDVRLTLFLRDAAKLGKEQGHFRMVEGDVMDSGVLKEAMTGQDVVYANLGGALDKQAESIVAAMKVTGVKRLIFIDSLGIYDEVPGAFGKWNKSMIGKYLPAFRRAADMIEASGLDYTIIRPAWLMDEDKVDYETTSKAEPFKGTEVSRKSVADLVVKLIDTPGWEIGGNLGVNKPNTDGDKPSFY
jgi:uncharacterized protein YbjT (DUF2867 family)